MPSVQINSCFETVWYSGVCSNIYFFVNISLLSSTVNWAKFVKSVGASEGMTTLFCEN